jgi:hypothetical protein
MKRLAGLISSILACSAGLLHAARPDPNTVHSDFNSTPDQRTDLVEKPVTGKSDLSMNRLTQAGTRPGI